MPSRDKLRTHGCTWKILKHYMRRGDSMLVSGPCKRQSFQWLPCQTLDVVESALLNVPATVLMCSCYLSVAARKPASTDPPLPS